MKVNSKKLIKSLLLFSALLVLAAPLYMYFSHHVQRLELEYPHLLRQQDFVEYEIKATRPKNWVNLKDISQYARWAIVLSEDWAFYQHEGIDLEQMKKALEQMVKQEKFRGASTITQQLIKNLYLSHERSLWRKLHEIILATKLERALSKERILELYLNAIEYGPGIYGIREASFHYFKKAPAGLSPREGAFLAMLLPSPKRYYRSFRQKKLTTFARHRVNMILTKMRMAKVLTPEEFSAEREARFSWEEH
jgi:monofunctional glycosyltransferase